MKPELFILAGPNGAGKTTCAATLIPLDVPFINADEIAKSLTGVEGASMDIRASRILLERISFFEREQKSFAMETNLANKGLQQRIKRLQDSGYSVTLIFLWLPSVDLAIDRVMERVRRGGHSVPAAVIRRRHRSGIENFFYIYRHIVNAWLFFDNAQLGEPMLLASQIHPGEVVVHRPEEWKKLRKGRICHGEG